MVNHLSKAEIISLQTVHNYHVTVLFRSLTRIGKWREKDSDPQSKHLKITFFSHIMLRFFNVWKISDLENVLHSLFRGFHIGERGVGPE